jgi:membrane-bound lytic murein transglycosylase B
MVGGGWPQPLEGRRRHLPTGYVRVQKKAFAGTRSVVATSASVLVLACLGGSLAALDAVPTASAAVAVSTAPVAAPGVDGGTASRDELPTPAVSTGAGSAPAPSATSVPSASGRRTVVAGDLAIPARVLAAYRSAAAALTIAQPGCHLVWQLLAGIGRIESDHAWLGDVRPDGTTVSLIVGPALDGSPGVATVHDTDRGRWDGDTVWDRAVGPMQFIPTTWVVLGRDGNHDGSANPSNVDDAALSAAYYLCAYGRDLDDPRHLNAAVHSYNHSDAYVAAVLAWAQAYTDGTVAAPVTAEPPAAASTDPRPSTPTPTSAPTPPGVPTGGPQLPGPVIGDARRSWGGPAPTPTPAPTTTSCPTVPAGPTASSDPSVGPYPATSEPSTASTPSPDGSVMSPPPGVRCPTSSPTDATRQPPTSTALPTASAAPSPAPTP